VYVLALVVGAACGRTELFSAGSGGCEPTDMGCVSSGGGIAGRGGGVVGGAGGEAGARAGTGTGGSGARGGIGGARPVCPTGDREICGNGLDDDCNGLSDCADPACFGASACVKPGVEVCNNGIDDDGDGLVDCADPDCAASRACQPSVGAEICGNGVDDNGDGLADCADPQCTTFAGCLTLNCSPDVDFGALAVHGASVTRMFSSAAATNAYATCAPAGGHGQVGRFQLTGATDVRADFSQSSGAAHVLALYRAGASQACDQNPLTCIGVGDVATATHTFTGLPAGVYWLIVESYPNAAGSSTVTLSTGSATTPEICNNGIDDDGNGLIDCADAACVNDPSCAASECVPDVKLGTLVVGAPAKRVSLDLATAPDRYRPTCAGTVPGGDQAIAFSLPQPAGVEVQYEETGENALAIFQQPSPGLACDADQLACVFEDDVSNAVAFTSFAAGDYLLIVKAGGQANTGTVTLDISAFTERKVEICNNGIDDDGNGLIDCADPTCFGIGACAAPACVPDQELGSLAVGQIKSATVSTSSGGDLYETSCSRGNGKEKILRVELTQPMALGIDCTDTGSHVLALSQQLSALDACDVNEVDCADPSVLPFGCGFAIPDLQPGTYYLIVQAFQAGDEGTVALTLEGQAETVREICDNGIDDDGDGFTDCADRKCVTSPECAKLACRADQSLGSLPLDGTARSAVVQTTMAGDDQMHTPCVSATGGQDADVDFQVPALADVTLTWAEVGNHDFALYPNEGALFSCDAESVVACVASGGTANGTHVFASLPPGRYHLIVDADAPGDEGGVVVGLAAVAAASH
jgi:hypothetical protein